MNYDDCDADQFDEFDTSLSSELNVDFNTLFFSLENLGCSSEKKMPRTFTVTSEYIPSSVESSFELREEYSTALSNDLGNQDTEKIAFCPVNLVYSTQTTLPETVTVASENVSSLSKHSFQPRDGEDLIDFSDDLVNSSMGKTPLDYLENALSEFVQFHTDPQISSTNCAKEVERTHSKDTKHDSPIDLASSLNYRICSAVTPTSHYGSPLSETQNNLSSLEEYKSCLNQTRQGSLIGAMESLQIKSARKTKKRSEDFEDFYHNSEIAIIVTPYEDVETSDSRDKNCETKNSAHETATFLQSSDIENLSFSGNTFEDRTAERTGMIGEEGNSEISKTAPSYKTYEIPSTSNFHDGNRSDEQNAPPTEPALRSKSNLEHLSSSANIPEIQKTERTDLIAKQIVQAVLSNEIPSQLDVHDKNREDEQNAFPAKTSLRSELDVENLLFLANIADNQTTDRTSMTGEEDTSEIATVQPYRNPKTANVHDTDTQEKQRVLLIEKDMESASSLTNIAKIRTTGRILTIGKEDKSEVVETISPCPILESSFSIEDLGRGSGTASRVLPKDYVDTPSKSVRPDAVPGDQKKQRKNPRVLTSQVRRQSLKYRRSSGQFVSMAEAMLKFQRGTPKRFRSTIKKNQNRSAQPRIKSLQKITCPVSPALRCKLRARPSKLPKQEERGMLEIEESRRNRFRVTKSPGLQKSIPPSGNSATSSSKDSNLLSSGEVKISIRKATPRRKTLVKSILSTEEGPVVEEVEIFNFGVPIQKPKSPLTKPEAFNFQDRVKRIPEKRKESGSSVNGDEKQWTTRPRSSAATSSITFENLEGAARKPLDLTFWERNELLLAKKKFATSRAREEKQDRVFHAKLAPAVKQVLDRGSSMENLGPPKVARSLKKVRGRETSTENFGPTNIAQTLKDKPWRGTLTENLDAVNTAPTSKEEPGRRTSTENSDPGNTAPTSKEEPGRGTSTQNLCPGTGAPIRKHLPGQTTSTENLGLAENKQKIRKLSTAGRSRGLSPAERSRGLSPAERSRGLSPAERMKKLSLVEKSRGLSPAEKSRGLSPACRSRGLSPSIGDRENRDPNVSSISNQCPKLKAPLSLYTEDRSKKRQEFDANIRRKEEEAEEQHREYEAYRVAQEKKEERELRRTMESRARPMPVFKQPKIAKSLKPLTDPQSPAWSWKKTKK